MYLMLTEPDPRSPEFEPNAIQPDRKTAVHSLYRLWVRVAGKGDGRRRYGRVERFKPSETHCFSTDLANFPDPEVLRRDG